MAIGLFGGSFNPPHEGHVHVCEVGLKRVGLDRIWWMVTPGNPLKDKGELSELEHRIEASRRIAVDPRIDVTALEAGLGSAYTEDTLSTLTRIRPRLRFVWLMGADNLAGFHRWQNWRCIAAMMPMVIVDRPGSTLAYRSAPAAIALSRYRVDEADARLMPFKRPPAWTFLHGPRSSLSSTQLRRNGLTSR